MNLRKKIAAVLLAAAMGITATPVTSFAEALSTESVAVEYNATVAKPSYLIKGSKGVRKIKLSCSTKGATIYYTTNGKKPTTSSKKYSGGLIVVKKDATIRAIAVKSGSKSAVMTKKIDIDTLLGDVTGNGTVDSADYSRFLKYKDGETSYVCKDNCDMNKDGKVTVKDIKLLKSYLDGDDDAEYEEDDSSSTIEKPEMTVYKVYGGKSVKLECDTQGATIYYTTNGSKPDKNDKKYTGKFVVDGNTTVKAVAYKGGSYSSVKTRNITVETCAAPTADKSADTQYEDSVTVTLKTTTPSSRICYTTDGSDPVKNGLLYKEPIELTENTTLKFYAECKGYANSKIITYNYKVKSNNYTISGRVWDDSLISEPNGVYQSGEAGINNITVSLLNIETNEYEETTTTSSIKGVAGSYQLTKAKPGKKYKVVFKFNGQKYRAYETVVAGGNQAVSTAFPAITIKYDGAHSQTGALLTKINSYANAVTNTYFDTYATTNATYTAAAQDVNLALRSNVYGQTELKFGKTKVESATGGVSEVTENTKIYSNDIISYILTVSNKSANQILNSCELFIYVPEDLNVIEIAAFGDSPVSCTSTSTIKYGCDVYRVTCPKILIGESIDIEILAKVPAGVKNGASVACRAEVVAYAYSGSCYDKNSVPGNFTGTVKEADEASALSLVAYTDSTASQTISWLNTNDYSPIPVDTYRVLKFKITNGTSDDDFNVYISDKSVVTGETTFKETSSGIECMLILKGVKAGSSNIVITLSKDSSKYIDKMITVV